MFKKNGQDQIHIFQDTKPEDSQIHQLAIIFCLKHTNHDSHPFFLF